jgi:tryptophanyl-tRNA synthetase
MAETPTIPAPASATPVAPKTVRVLSGVQPSGTLHLGNYFGAIRQHIDLQSKPGHSAFYFIANYHAMTTVQDAELLRKYTFDVACDYLALGLDPKVSVFYRQSDLPEVCELAWILSTVTGKGLLERAHSFKDKVARGIEASMGLFTYPILMAADILIVGADIVPVGQDQVQHLEMTRDMAGYFNTAFKSDVFKMPKEFIPQDVAKVPGIDGEKMAKSYGNAIGIFEEPKAAKKRIMAIKTDSTPVEAPKNPDTCNVMALLKLFAEPAEIADWEGRYRAGGLGYGTVKTRLAELYEAKFGPLRERRAKIAGDPGFVEDVLADGARRARAEAAKVMDAVRSACGLGRGR